MRMSQMKALSLMSEEKDIIILYVICSDIARWKDKKESERANAKYNEILYFGLEEEP